MIINKKIYKYTSIISFAIVVMLIGNLMAPIFTMAEETNGKGFLSDIGFNESENSLTITGTLPEGFTSYKLYWSVGEIPIEKLPENATDEQKENKIEIAINWSNQADHLIADVVSSNSKEINSTVKANSDRTKEYKYNALCVATTDDGSRIMQIVQKTIGAKKEIPNTIEISLKAEQNKIDINIKDQNYDIKVIKLAKSDNKLSIDDFADVGESLQFDSSKNVSMVKNVTEPGKYYVYAETTAGTKSVQSCLVQNTNSPVEIQIAKKAGTNKLYINATTENSGIKETKYYINGSLEEAGNKVKTEGKNISAISSVEIGQGDNNKYIAVYAIDKTGYTKTRAINISTITELETIPWNIENEEPEEEVAEEPQQEEPKQEEPKQEEPKQEEPKQEEPKQEEPKQEEPKQEEPKQEEPKQEEPKQEEPKQEEPKQEEPKQEEPKQEEPKQEEPKQEAPKQEEKKESKFDEVISVIINSEKQKYYDVIDENGYIDIDKVVEKENNEVTQKNEKDNEKKDVEAPEDSNRSLLEKNAENKIDDNKTDLVDTGRTDKVIPKAGSDNTFTIIAILFFASISIVSLVKYKTIKE